MAEKIQLKVLGVSRSANSHDFYCLLLEEIEGDKKLPIIIGRNEAQTVVVSVEKTLLKSRPNLYTTSSFLPLFL